MTTEATEYDALCFAQHTFGPNAVVWKHTPAVGEVSFRIGIMRWNQDPNHEPLGCGSSWSEAIAQAQAAAKILHTSPIIVPPGGDGFREVALPDTGIPWFGSKAAKSSP